MASTCKHYGPPLVAIYVMADIGSVLGGWRSSRLIKRGVALGRARKMAMLACAVVRPAGGVRRCMRQPVAGGGADRPGLRRPSGLFRQSLCPAVGPVPALGGGLGRRAGRPFRRAGRHADEPNMPAMCCRRIGSYTPIFIFASVAYLFALLVVHLIVPRYAPVDPDSSDDLIPASRSRPAISPPTPRSARIARELYARGRGPADHQPARPHRSALVRRRRAVPRSGAAAARRPTTTCSACSTARASRWRRSACRPRDGGAGRDRPARRSGGCFAEHYHLFRGTPVAALARPRLRRRVRPRRAARRRDRRPLLRHASPTLLQRRRLPAARPVRALQHRGDRHHRERRSTTLDWHATIRDSGWDGRVVTAYRPDAVDRSRASRASPPTSTRSARSPARTPAAGTAISTPIATAAPSSASSAPPPPTTAIRRPRPPTCRRAEAEALFAKVVAGKADAAEARAVPRPDADRDGADEPRGRAGDADPSRARWRNHNRRLFAAASAATRAPTSRPRTDYVARAEAAARRCRQRAATSPIILFTLDETSLCARTGAAGRHLSGAEARARPGGSTTAPKACAASAS